ncbi:MAG TPA: hypothetical protein PKC03_11395 [Dokdonella sp.]|nr:hypothetical protein [Dokdonella sp.]
MRSIHVIAGLIALLAGALALIAAKGSPAHRRGGMVFVIAMLAMTSSAFVMATLLHPNRLNVVAALVTFYLVATGLLTVRRPFEQSRRPVTAFMLMALATSAYALSIGILAINSSDGRIDGMPPQPLFLFAGVALLGAIGDLRLLRSASIEATRRLGRHLWRMGFAMFVATASFFLGQARLFPAVLRKSGLLVIPVLLVLGTVIYWMVRTRLRHRRAGAELAAPKD